MSVSVFVDIIKFSNLNDPRKPSKVLRDLGIIFIQAEPQIIADQWKFHNCTNIPDELPSFVRVVR